jgi:hypothetical protein
VNYLQSKYFNKYAQKTKNDGLHTPGWLLTWKLRWGRRRRRCQHLLELNKRRTDVWCLLLIANTVESWSSDLRLSDIPFYPTCRVGTFHFINSHSEGLNSIETALAYVEQQREETATDVLLFRRWRDLAAKKRKEAQKPSWTWTWLRIMYKWWALVILDVEDLKRSGLCRTLKHIWIYWNWWGRFGEDSVHISCYRDTGSCELWTNNCHGAESSLGR